MVPDSQLNISEIALFPLLAYYNTLLWSYSPEANFKSTAKESPGVRPGTGGSRRCNVTCA